MFQADMATTLDAQFTFQQICDLNLPQQKKIETRDLNDNSCVTTRSGTPDAIEHVSDNHNELNYTAAEGKKFLPASSGLEIGVKPKKKQFRSTEERNRFVEDYKMKLKTELCKNFELRGWCKFGENCSFAHGKHELQEKMHLNVKYKTKPCQQFHLQGHCNYGNRCQYLHADALMPNIFYQPSSSNCVNAERAHYTYALLQELFRLVSTDCKVEKLLKKIPKKSRLPVFESITSKN